MIVKSKKTGERHYITVEDWNKMEERDPGSQRRYVIVDREDIQPKQEFIEIKSINTVRQNITEPLSDIAIYSSGFDSESYSISQWTKFLEGKDINEYREFLENDSRQGIKKLLNG